MNLSANASTPASSRFESQGDAERRGDLNLIQILQVLAENLRLLVLVPIACALMAYGLTYTSAPVFSASTSFITPQQQQSSAAAMLTNPSAGPAVNLGTGTPTKNPSDQYISFLRSRSVQDGLIERFKLTERYSDKGVHQIRAMLAARAVFTGGKDGLITVAFDDTDPVFAAQIANAYVDELGKLLNRLVVAETQQRRTFFERQLRSAKDSLVHAEQILKSSALGNSALKTSPQAVVDELSALKASVSAQEIKVAGMRGYLVPGASDLRQAQFELAALQRQLSRAETERPSHIGTTNDYVAKFREFKYQETLYELIARQYEIARVDESRESSIIQVVDIAQPPPMAYKPRRLKMTATGGVAAAVILVIFVLGREWMRIWARDAGTTPKFEKLLATLRAALGFSRPVR
jgi:tyrosine-protein kinase Etk/Wzc